MWEVYVVRVGLPVQDEARRGLRGEGERALRELLHHGVAVAPVGEVRRSDHAGVLAEHALGAAEPARGVRLIDAREDRVERARVVRGAFERVGEQAVTGDMIGPVCHGLAIGVDHEVAGGAKALKPLTGEPAEVGAGREQIDDRAVTSRRGAEVPLGFERFAERDQGEHVAGRLVMPLLRDPQGLVGVPAAERLHHVGELAGQGRVTGANTPYVSRVGGIARSRDVRHSNEVAPASRRLARERRDRGDVQRAAWIDDEFPAVLGVPVSSRGHPRGPSGALGPGGTRAVHAAG